MSFAVSFIPDSTYDVVSQINAVPFEVAPPWHPNPEKIVVSGYPNPPVTYISGSMLFPGTNSSYISFPNGGDFSFGTGQFTIEWFQYMTSAPSHPRVFSMGNYSTPDNPATVAVSIEGGIFYFWIKGSTSVNYSMGTPYLNTWTHMAVTRDSSNIIRIFQNGVLKYTSSANTTDFNNTTSVLCIGNQMLLDSPFPGLITNFHWLSGTALYTAAFTRPSQPIVPVTGTKLLLLATTSGTVVTDSSTLGKTATNVGITWDSRQPF